MKIEENSQSLATVAFQYLGQGSCFTLPDHPLSAFYMVVACPGKQHSTISLNAVNLRNGNLVCFGQGTRVVPLPEGTFLPYGK